MDAAAESFTESGGREGVAIGIIPGTTNVRGDRVEYRTKGSAYPNASTEIAIFTHLLGDNPEGAQSRNHINVLSADLVIALPGGVGTHAEIQLAKRYGKPVLLFLGPAHTILGKTTADLRAEGFQVIHDFPELLAAANRIINPQRSALPAFRLVLGKCILRSWEWNDAEALQRHANNRKIWRNLHDGFPSPYTMRDARRWLAHALSTPIETAYAIDVGGECVGGLGFLLKEGRSSRTAEIGYWLGEAYWNRGIVTECVRAMTSHILDTYPEICRLYAQVFEWNTRSVRVLEKAGYSPECILRKAAVKAGEVIDLRQYVYIRN